MVTLLWMLWVMNWVAGTPQFIIHLAGSSHSQTSKVGDFVSFQSDGFHLCSSFVVNIALYFIVASCCHLKGDNQIIGCNELLSRRCLVGLFRYCCRNNPWEC